MKEIHLILLESLHEQKKVRSIIRYGVVSLNTWGQGHQVWLGSGHSQYRPWYHIEMEYILAFLGYYVNKKHDECTYGKTGDNQVLCSVLGALMMGTIYLHMMMLKKAWLLYICTCIKCSCLVYCRTIWLCKPECGSPNVVINSACVLFEGEKWQKTIDVNLVSKDYILFTTYGKQLVSNWICINFLDQIFI